MNAPTPYESDIATAAALMADPTRAAMLRAMLEGKPLAAGELARIAGVTAATASAHLARLLDGGLVAVTRQGRHRYYRLAGYEVAEALEAVARVSADIPVRTLRQSREAQALAAARTCYDHLAGRAGVALLESMLEQGILTEPDEDAFEVTSSGAGTIRTFGINVGELRRGCERGRRRFAGTCLDWTERRRHLSGALATAITTRLFETGWIERGPRRRSVVITEAGRKGLAETFGWTGAP
jgi:DNA-binding transcriptional ArsR family regulator